MDILDHLPPQIPVKMNGLIMLWINYQNSNIFCLWCAFFSGIDMRDIGGEDNDNNDDDDENDRKHILRASFDPSMNSITISHYADKKTKCQKGWGTWSVSPS